MQEAREFFGIDPLWQTPVRAGNAGGDAAQIDADRSYLFAPITIDLDYYQENPEKIRGDGAHEAAHLLTEEIWQLWRHLPSETSGDDSVTGKLMRDAIESATVRLERLFMREAGRKVVTLEQFDPDTPPTPGGDTP